MIKLETNVNKINDNENKSDNKVTLNNAGFSLVEVLVAMAILIVVSLPILASINSSIRLNADARSKQKALSIDESIMEKICQCDTEEIRKYFDETDKEKFDLLKGIIKTGDSISYSELEKDAVGNFTEVHGSTTKPDVYYFGISGVEIGGSKYDALITIDKNNENVNDINAKQLAKLNKIGGKDSVTVDNNGVVEKDEFLDSLCIEAGVTSSQIQQLDITLTEDGAALAKKYYITSKMTLKGKEKLIQNKLEIGENPPKNMFIIYTPTSNSDKIVIHDKINSAFEEPLKVTIIKNANKYGDPGVLNLDIKFDSGSNTGFANTWKNYILPCSNDDFTINVNGSIPVGTYTSQQKKSYNETLTRMLSATVEVYEHRASLTNRYKNKKVSTLTSAIMN